MKIGSTLKKEWLLCFSFLLGLSILTLQAQAPKANNPESKAPKIRPEDSLLVTTKHTHSKTGKTFGYTAHTGYMLLKEEYGKPRAKVFYIAYTLDNANKEERPVTFCFNGGPGSSSVWLHMGTIGPKRIVMTEDGMPTPPPYKVVENESTWLSETDLVFIDPVSTGYSMPMEGVNKSEFHGYNEDIQSVGEFIRLYCSKNQRWASPKFLAGESYGTTRAAGLSGYLQDRYGMYLNGITLVSAVLQFQTLRFEKSNELPYQLFLPTYAATGYYHKKVKAGSLNELLKKVEEFADTEYAVYLIKGDKATEQEHEKIAEKLSAFTGLSKEYCLRTKNRIQIFRFTKELLRDKKETVGRFDSRVKASDYDEAGETYEFDPSFNYATYGPYAQAINHYLSTELKFFSDLPYEILTSKVQPWNYNNVQNQYLNVAETLRSAMVKNPFMKVLLCSGYYDLATPYHAANYTFDHMFLPPNLKKNVVVNYYNGGHMFYTVKSELQKLKRDVDSFYKLSTSERR